MKIDNVEFFMTRVSLQSYAMMDLNLVSSVCNKGGVPGMKKTTLRIDMTPVVDLGFLLIAFFILTTELSRPVVADLRMAHDAPNPTGIAQSRSLTILLGKQDEVFFYFGIEGSAFKNTQILRTSYNEETGIGNFIRQKQNKLEKRSINRAELIVLIKPGKDCSYQNLVNALNEMLVNRVTKYFILEPEKDELAFLTTHI
jgi:biopolymer transport protein ExbD